MRVIVKHTFDQIGEMGEKEEKAKLYATHLGFFSCSMMTRTEAIHKVTGAGPLVELSTSTLLSSNSNGNNSKDQPTSLL